MTDFITTVAMHQESWGTFVEPAPGLADAEDPRAALNISLHGGHRADLGVFEGRNTIFDRTAARVAGDGVVHVDQCSEKHYFDLFGAVERDHLEVTRLVDVGVFMGGSAAILAGCVEPMGLELDLVDVNEAYLQFTYERLRRLFPGAMSRVRMFHGDLTTYVRNVLLDEGQTRALVHHDASHAFDRVVRDLSSLYFARDRVHSVVLHGTHVRGAVQHLNFVDAAVHAVFGLDAKYEPLGANFRPEAPVTHPNEWDGNYFLAGAPEAMQVRLDGADWKYPHPTMELESFMPVKAQPEG